MSIQQKSVEPPIKIFKKLRSSVILHQLSEQEVELKVKNLEQKEQKTEYIFDQLEKPYNKAKESDISNYINMSPSRQQMTRNSFHTPIKIPFSISHLL